MILFFALVGLAFILAMLSLMILISGISKSYTNWGNVILFSITTIVLPFLIAVIVKKIDDNLDTLAHTYLFSFIAIQLITLVFIYRRFKDS